MAPNSPLRRAIRSAPGTYAWLAALTTTTALLSRLPADRRRRILTEASTNLDNLERRPLPVLAASAVVTDTSTASASDTARTLAQYAVMFTVIHAPTERWLGTRRWLAVVGIGHVGATLISQGAVAAGIRSGRLDPDLRETVDVGVSYGLAAATGVLAYRFAEPWRDAIAGASLAYYAVPLIRNRTFTDLGHVSALALGMACRGLARGD